MSAYQQHFLDLCEMLGQPKPAEADPDGAWYCFERGVTKLGGSKGWADVWMKEKFGWEYKGKHKDLDAAYAQLQLYREALENPPLLVVCDLNRFVVHTNFTNTVKEVHAFDLDGLADAANLAVLCDHFTNPEALKPRRTTEEVTKEVAAHFAPLADGNVDASSTLRTVSCFAQSLEMSACRPNTDDYRHCIIACAKIKHKNEKLAAIAVRRYVTGNSRTHIIHFRGQHEVARPSMVPFQCRFFGRLGRSHNRCRRRIGPCSGS